MISFYDYIGSQLAWMPATVAIVIIIAASTLMAQGQSPQEQIICAQQAQKAFHNHNNAAARVFPELVGSNYQSHYNTKINKCLIMINEMHEMNGQMFAMVTLSDAIEPHELAYYFWSTENDKVEPPPQCQFSPTPQEITVCSSRAEFDAFVSKYMEQ